MLRHHLKDGGEVDQGDKGRIKPLLLRRIG
jgi:hypothetical protein